MVEHRALASERTFAEDWAGRREVLNSVLRSVTVTRGRPARRTREQLLARLSFDWVDMGQWDAPSDEQLEAISRL